MTGIYYLIVVHLEIVILFLYNDHLYLIKQVDVYHQKVNKSYSIKMSFTYNFTFKPELLGLSETNIKSLLSTSIM
jgi:hypothetical protein